MIRALAASAALVFVVAGCDRKDDDGEISAAAICGSSEILGTAIAEVEGRGACGIEHPVRVLAVSGITLTPPATLNCKAARALNAYVGTRAVPLIGNAGGGLDHLEVAASYACRSRNSQGDRMSEHALGNAIDISAFVLENGEALVVARDWGKATVRALHNEGCGIFGTVLGPESDGFHRDHLHFDVAGYRNGPYCR